MEELDKRLLVQLRDGRKIVGVLRSFDQFANLVLEDATERVIVGNLFCEIPMGLYIIRGENVVLLGEVDPDRYLPLESNTTVSAEIPLCLTDSPGVAPSGTTYQCFNESVRPRSARRKEQSGMQTRSNRL